MNLLAIDTATEACSAALDINGVVTGRFEICPQLHSQKLLPMVDELLVDAGHVVSDLDYLVFGRGPGSFTGVRIATGMIQGLSIGARLPVVGVSTLAAMAQQVMDLQNHSRVAVAIDARMDEVYFAQYSNQQGIAVLDGQEQVLPPDEVLKLLSNAQAICGTGWQAYTEFEALTTELGSPTVLYPDARSMLKIAHTMIKRGDVMETEQVQPTYLRDKVTWKKLPGRE